MSHFGKYIILGKAILEAISKNKGNKITVYIIDLHQKSVRTTQKKVSLAGYLTY